MSRLSLAGTLLSLFASPEEAQSIEGDLLEEARSRGRIWFWSHVVRTTLALWWQGFSASPFALGGLTVASGAAWFLIALLAEADDSPGAFVFGTILVGLVCARAVPTRGIHAAFAVAVLAGPMANLAFLLLDSPIRGAGDLMLSFASGLPLLLGSVAGRRQVVKKAARA